MSAHGIFCNSFARHVPASTPPTTMPPAFKTFSEMTPEDYAALGFRCGLEVHQQLLTRRKLFCRCPARLYSDKYDAEILRHMRPTLSELGEYDGTALMEFKTRKNIIYRINRESVCTYEMDDTPPFEINDEALDIAIEIALAEQCVLVHELHVARKQYLDGSIPTGFQRTTIVGVEGKIPFAGRQIQVIQLGLEEDACREVSDQGHTRIYKTDRLGMPLIETVTGPDMRTPHEAAEVGQIIRRITRSTGKVRTGIGAAREDVNVSITGGTRVEIKGVPRLPLIPLLTYHEAMRQHALLGIREELRGRGVTTESFRHRVEDVTRFLENTQFAPIRGALAARHRVACVTLCGFRDILLRQTQTGTSFAKEISDRVRVVACLMDIPNMIHSDLGVGTVSVSEWSRLRKATGAGPNDTMVLVWGPEADMKTAGSEVAARAKEATLGVPSETRQALRDGTTAFERILPGPDRMYPDTDLPPKRIPPERWGRIKAGVPEAVWLREARYRKMGVPEDVIRVLSHSRWAKLFDRLTAELHVPPVLAGVTLIRDLKRLRRSGLDVSLLTEEDLHGVFVAYVRGEYPREAIVPRIADRLRATDASPLSTSGPGGGGGAAAIVAPLLAETISGAPPIKDPQKRFAFLMGRLMKSLRGRVAGTDVAAALRVRLDGGPTQARS